MSEQVGIKQGKIGKGNPPKEHQFKPGQSGNPKGRAKGVPTRSTIACKVLKMKGLPPSLVLRNLEKMYPKFFEKKGRGWSNEFLATVRLAQKAIMKGDVLAYNAIMDSAYGRAQQSLKMGFDESVGELREILEKAEKILNEHRRKDKNNKGDKS